MQTPNCGVQPQSSLIGKHHPQQLVLAAALRKWVCVGGFLAGAASSAGWLWTGLLRVGLQITWSGGGGGYKGGVEGTFSTHCMEVFCQCHGLLPLLPSGWLV